MVIINVVYMQFVCFWNKCENPHCRETGPHCVLSHTLFNIHTADMPTAPVQVMLYADDITITSTHTSMSAARKYIQPYLHNDWAKHKCGLW